MWSFLVPLFLPQKDLYLSKIITQQDDLLPKK